MAQHERSVELLRLMRGENKEQEPLGIKILVVQTTEPAPFTFTFEGGSQALDIDLFEIPVSLYPLKKGDRLLVFPLVGRDNGQRWAALEKINGGITQGSATSSTQVQVSGVGRTYGSSDLIYPKGGIVAGDTVSLQPTLVGTKIKYVITERH